jgi:hypothetical protein
MPKLLDELRLASRTRRHSTRAERACVAWARDFILFHKKRHPRELGKAVPFAEFCHLFGFG